MVRLSFLLIITILLITGCGKDELSPSEMLIGQWELVYIQRMDTVFFNTRYKDGYVARQINYNGDPLIISYDTLGNFRWHTDLPWSFISSHYEETYNLIFYIEIFSEGTWEITEECRDLNNNPLFSWQYTCTWQRVEKGINNYEFYFERGDPFTNQYPSKVFAGDYSIKVYDEDIKRNHFTIHETSFTEPGSNGIMTYEFKKK